MGGHQLVAAEGTPALAAARTLLLVPDLLRYWLGGPTGAEVTNASTTALLDVSTRTCLGNVLVQAQALGAAPGSLPEMRALVRSWLSGGSAGTLREFMPSGGSIEWAAAARRIALE